jgi:hypothetical protein
VAPLLDELLVEEPLLDEVPELTASDEALDVVGSPEVPPHAARTATIMQHVNRDRNLAIPMPAPQSELFSVGILNNGNAARRQSVCISGHGEIVMQLSFAGVDRDRAQPISSAIRTFAI